MTWRSWEATISRCSTVSFALPPGLLCCFLDDELTHTAPSRFFFVFGRGLPCEQAGCPVQGEKSGGGRHKHRMGAVVRGVRLERAMWCSPGTADSLDGSPDGRVVSFTRKQDAKQHAAMQAMRFLLDAGYVSGGQARKEEGGHEGVGRGDAPSSSFRWNGRCHDSHLPSLPLPRLPLPRLPRLPLSRLPLPRFPLPRLPLPRLPRLPLPPPALPPPALATAALPPPALPARPRAETKPLRRRQGVVEVEKAALCP